MSLIKREVGSLDVAKSADVQSLSHNPYAVPPERLPDITVPEVYVAGRRQAASGP